MESLPLQRLETEVAEPRFALARGVEAGPKHHEAAAHIVMVARDLHLAVELRPCPTVGAVVEGDDMPVVGEAQVHPSSVGIGGATALQSILVGDEAVGIEAQTG